MTTESGEPGRGDEKPPASRTGGSGIWGRLDDLLHLLLGSWYPKGTKLRDVIWNDTVQTVTYAFAIALVIRVVAYEPFNIPSGSMYPTLMVGDYLFVSKYPYGYSRHSFPFSFPPFDGRILEGEPERGDVAVFKEPRNQNVDYIKRVIGLPGDTIQVVDGVLRINGEPVVRRRIEDYPYLVPPGDSLVVRNQRIETDSDGRTHRVVLEGDGPGRGGFGSQTVIPQGHTLLVPQYVEKLPNGREHRLIEVEGDRGSNDNTRVYVVPDGHYFMMGDNRDNSADSRSIGPVPIMNMIGRAEVLFFSTDGSARLWEFWKWPFATRYSRLFDGVE